MERKGSDLWMVGFLVIVIVYCTANLTKSIIRNFFPPEIEEVYLADDIYYFDKDSLEITFEGKSFKVVFHDKVAFNKYYQKFKKESIIKEHEENN